MAGFLRSVVPLGLRLRLAGWFARNRWFPAANRWAQGLIRDLESVDPKLFHKFMWEHHLDRYGLAYEAERLFSSRVLNGTTRAFEAFEQDLRSSLASDPSRRIGSVLDLGCSVGHVLRALETEVLPDAEILVGLDIDRPATEAGTAYLSKAGSKVRLLCGDLEDLDRLLGEERFDFAFAAGSLSYLNETDAGAVVGSLLGRTNELVALVGLANPDRPNGELDGSVFRDEFGKMWTHDFAGMVESRGWRVVTTRWEPPVAGDPQGLYFVFARPHALPSPEPAR